ncbi:MAG: hypothetical protein IJT48_09745 [Bacteroidaceae bacterium]|nr:hypothetical protein [Bacteroidaceae bacterium]
MRLKQIILLVLVLAFAGTAQAANTLKVQNVKLAPGESVTLNIELTNETTNLMGWQCDIVLPEGLSLALKPNGKPAATLGERFSPTEHSISSSRLANGAYRFIATSMDGEAIPGSSGTLFTVTLQADATLQPGGTLTGKVANIEFNTQDNQKLTLDDLSFTVTIPDPDRMKCATPTIAYDHGELVFVCETEDVTFVSEVTANSVKGGEGERVTLTAPVYVITVIAKKEGYDDSEAATATIQWGDGRPVFTGFSSVMIDTKGYSDVNSDGTVDVADIATIISTMAAQAGKQTEMEE